MFYFVNILEQVRQQWNNLLFQGLVEFLCGVIKARRFCDMTFISFGRKGVFQIFNISGVILVNHIFPENHLYPKLFLTVFLLFSGNGILQPFCPNCPPIMVTIIQVLLSPFWVISVLQPLEFFSLQPSITHNVTRFKFHTLQSYSLIQCYPTSGTWQAREA